MDPDNGFELDPEEFRRLGYRMIDSIVEQVQAESTNPVLPQCSGEQSRRLLSKADAY